MGLPYDMRQNFAAVNLVVECFQPFLLLKLRSFCISIVQRITLSIYIGIYVFVPSPSDDVGFIKRDVIFGFIRFETSKFL